MGRRLYPRMVSSNASVDFVDFPVRHVAVSPHLQRLRLVQALANGGGLDYAIGRLDAKANSSGFDAVREIFRYHATHEEEYRGLSSHARIALLTGPRPDVEEHRGWFRVLAEHHFLFDVLTVPAADEAALGRYEFVVVPGLEPVADGLARRLDAWVEGGGTLVVSGLSGLRDEEYEVRSEPPFECLGIEGVREIRPDLRGAYLGSTTTRASAASPIPTCCTWTGRTWTPSTARTCDASSV